LIAAELVFGVASGKGGLGWYIFESKNQLDIPEVFAGLLTIIMIGLLVENVIFPYDRKSHGAPLGHADVKGDAT
jgi:NitT/TauT family transport system permease protein